MPLAHVRRFRVALWIALLVLLIPLSLTFRELATDDTRPWLRLGSLVVVAATLVAALARQRSFETRVRSQQAADEAVRASEAKFSVPVRLTRAGRRNFRRHSGTIRSASWR